MSNADCDKAREAEAKEKLSDTIQTITIALLKEGHSIDKVKEWLQTKLNEADMEGTWEVTVTKVDKH